MILLANEYGMPPERAAFFMRKIIYSDMYAVLDIMYFPCYIVDIITNT